MSNGRSALDLESSPFPRLPSLSSEAHTSGAPWQSRQLHSGVERHIQSRLRYNEVPENKAAHTTPRDLTRDTNKSMLVHQMCSIELNFSTAHSGARCARKTRTVEPTHLSDAWPRISALFTTKMICFSKNNISHTKR